ncbi:hypothetical protein D9615_004415 [Tricholomella constricta]|uniref:Yip1 domain-containing protein n=1 Tax=Tricholomella constricta TaxID=117010 RepID=A0A8H5HEX4_9AGAR|nr:hypothetical protein D9615_004415 [Tricholomella constricta]
MNSARMNTPLTGNSQFIQADDDDDLDEDDIPGFTHPGLASPTDKGKARAREPEQLAPPSSAARGTSSVLSGNIGSSVNGATRPSRQTVGGLQVETRYSGVDTLDEPVTTTIARDLLSIYSKLVQVLYPRKSSGREVLRDWDLWGPLILCLALGIMLSLNAPASQALGVFTSVIVICSLGALAVTVQAKLLGGRVSFFQGLCVLGYCIAPLNIAALVACFVHCEVATYDYRHCAQQPYPYSPVPANILRPNIIVPHQPVLPISSYSTLTGALDFSNVTSSPSKNRTHSTYKNRSSTNAYSASQHDPTRSQGRTRSNSQTSGPPSSSRSVRGVHRQCYPEEIRVPQPRRVPGQFPTGPTNHILVPQLEHYDDDRRKWCSDPAFRHESIIFQSENIPEPGVRVGKISHSAYPPPILGADDTVFAAAGDREVKLWILWPGYNAEPLQKRIKTQGGRITRQLLLTLVANLVLDFAYEINRKKIPVERGYTEWAIGDKNHGIVGGELFITRLVHRGGSNWQPELWAPRRR